MPSFSDNTFASYFKRILQFGHSGNTGTPTALTNIQSGDGVASSMSASDDVLSVQPQNDDTTGTMLVKNASGSNILTVDTSNSKVLMGASQVPPTLFKEMGIYEFSPNAAGYHYPLVANIMVEDAAAFSYDDDWGNGTDPATTLDVSGLTNPENAVAVYWYLDNNITIDSVRYMTRANGSVTLNFHLFSYRIDVSTHFGDLSIGTVHANASVSATTGVKTGTFTLDEADIDVNKVVIGFVENVTSATDITVAFNIKYHIR